MMEETRIPNENNKLAIKSIAFSHMPLAAVGPGALELVRDSEQSEFGTLDHSAIGAPPMPRNDQASWNSKYIDLSISSLLDVL